MKLYKSKYKFTFLVFLVTLLFFAKPILFSQHSPIQTISDKESINSSSGQFGEYSRDITLNALTPMANYQVKIELNSTNFDYTHLNSNGSDIRFYDQSHNPLNYWVETWNYGGDSLIWVKIPSMGTSSFRMCYGNSSATSESNGDGVFLLYDDFEGTSLDPAKWTSEGDAYSFISVSGGEVRIYSDCPGTYWPRQTLGFHDYWKDHGKTYSWHAITGGATFQPTEDVWLTGEMHWINSTSAPYYENDVFYSEDVDNPDGPLSVRLTTDTTYYGPGTGWGSWITSVDDTLGVPGRTLRLRLWSDRTGIADLRVDWVAVREWSDIEPLATIGPEISQEDPPEINILNPLTNEIFGYIAPNFQLSIFESHLNTTWYSLDNGLTNITFSGFSGNIDQTEWDKFSNGTVNIRFYANNSWGNESSKEVMVRKDIIEPVISINSPVLYELFGSIPPDFDITVTESNPDTMWYTLDSGATNVTFGSVTGSIDQTEWDSKGNGTVTIGFYAKDEGGNKGFAEIIVRKDVNIPLITINTPNTNDIIGSQPPHYNITVVEPNIDLMWYTLNNGVTTVSFTEITGTIDQTEWDNFGNGSVTIIFYANDSVGNIAQASVRVNKDVLSPIITINSPQDSEVFGFTAPDYDLSIVEFNLDSMWYSLDYGVTVIPIYSLTGTIDQTEWEKKGGGTVPIRFYANDSLGHESFTDVTIIKDINLPLITIFSPSAGDIFGDTPPDYDISITESNLDSYWYTIDSGATNISISSLSGTIVQTEWDKLGNGTVTIRFYAEDEGGNEGFTEIIVRKDINIPLITINNPIIDDILGFRPPQFDVTVVEPNIDVMWYTLDNGITTILFTELTGTIDQTEWDKFGDGIVVIRFYVRDKGDNEAFAEVRITKDLVAPLITINEPDFGDTFLDFSPLYDIIIEETNLDSYWYSLDGGNTNISISSLSGIISESDWDDLPNGHVELLFYAKDTAGNIGQASVIITKNTTEIPGTPPPGIPGYNLIALLGVTLAVTLILTKRKLKK